MPNQKQLRSRFEKRGAKNVLLISGTSLEITERALGELGFKPDAVYYRRERDGVHVGVQKDMGGIRVTAHRDIFRGLVHQLDFRFNQRAFLNHLEFKITEKTLEARSHAT